MSELEGEKESKRGQEETVYGAIFNSKRSLSRMYDKMMNLAHLNCIWIQMRILRCACMDRKWKRSNDKIVLKKITLFFCMLRLYILEVILWSVCVCVRVCSYAFFFVLFDFDHSFFFVVHITFSLMYGMSTTMGSVRRNRSKGTNVYVWTMMHTLTNTWTTSPRPYCSIDTYILKKWIAVNEISDNLEQIE